MENKLLIMVIILLIGKNKDREFSSLKAVSDFINTMQLNPMYTVEKINIVKKIGPYFPEDYIPLINKSILFTEKLIKINELVDFMQNEEYRYVKEAIAVNNNKERLSKIIGIIQREMPKTDLKNMGTVMDLIVNIDKYKTIFTMLNSVMSNQDGLKDTNSLMALIPTLLGSENTMDSEKTNEMNKMMEIFKLLNTPKKENNIESNKIEITEKLTKE